MPARRQCLTISESKTGMRALFIVSSTLVVAGTGDLLPLQRFMVYNLTSFPRNAWMSLLAKIRSRHRTALGNNFRTRSSSSSF
ncbi:hypothetical protein RRG08_033880 [Elysia crispata]|uniref:Uncharacterized protein n=1 Tax=Elysia crispata TaxID=231223 RepID=A0AAE1B938_9GAST|nr:hypothetical protein RRG08_033880 [Elysia crispata]